MMGSKYQSRGTQQQSPIRMPCHRSKESQRKRLALTVKPTITRKSSNCPLRSPPLNCIKKPKRAAKPAPFDLLAYLAKDDVLKVRPVSHFVSSFQIVRPLGNVAISAVSLVEERSEQAQYAAKRIVRSAKAVWNQFRVLTSRTHPGIIAV
jgi:hypothetical protein